MRIHKKGIVPILVVAAFLVVFFLLLHLVFPEQTTVHYILYGVGFLFFCMVVRFFRHPRRNVIVSDEHVICAADGTVVAIEEIDGNGYFKDRRIQVSIFMSPLNVHVNWYPVSGTIAYTEYHRGAHYPAWFPKSSRENERMSIVVETPHGHEVMMVQIAGAMARRVYTNGRPGNYVFQGEEAGIIKFGSRVDHILPINAHILVQLHQQVRACETVIARLK